MSATLQIGSLKSLPDRRSDLCFSTLDRSVVQNVEPPVRNGGTLELRKRKWRLHRRDRFGVCPPRPKGTAAKEHAQRKGARQSEERDTFQ
jgi:hypothetical protein